MFPTAVAAAGMLAAGKPALPGWHLHQAALLWSPMGLLGSLMGPLGCQKLLGSLRPVQVAQAFELLLVHAAAVLVEILAVPHAACASVAAS